MATAQEIAAAIASLSAAYRAEFDKATALTWGRALQDLDGSLLTEAVSAWIKNSPKLPRPSEILQTARIIAERRRLAEQPRALSMSDAERERQLDVNRRGVAMVKNQLRQGKLRVGQRVDDVLADEPEA